MKLRILSVLGCLVYAISMHGMASFKTMLRDHKKGTVTAQAVVDAYDNFKQRIDIELAKQALRVTLGTSIEALREKANKPAAANYRNMAPSKKEKAAQSQRNQKKAQLIANEREKACDIHRDSARTRIPGGTSHCALLCGLAVAPRSRSTPTRDIR